MSDWWQEQKPGEGQAPKAETGPRPFEEQPWWPRQLLRRARFLAGQCSDGRLRDPAFRVWRADRQRAIRRSRLSARRLALPDYGDEREQIEHLLDQAERALAGDLTPAEEGLQMPPERVSAQRAAEELARRKAMPAGD